MNTLNLFFKIFPWIIISALLGWMLFREKTTHNTQQSTEVVTNTLLTRVEQMGKMELVKYNFQEVTEVKKIAQTIDLKIFKYKPVPDTKGVLISQGSAVGCIDFSKIDANSILQSSDTIYITLPDPEICYFKIDLEKSRLYDLQINYMGDDERKEFIQEMYKIAEEEVKKTALASGILEQTKENAHTILRPIMERLTGSIVMINFPMPTNIALDNQ